MQYVLEILKNTLNVIKSILGTGEETLLHLKAY